MFGRLIRLIFASAGAIYLAWFAVACQAAPTPPAPTAILTPLANATRAPHSSAINTPSTMNLRGRFVYTLSTGSIALEDAGRGAPQIIFSAKEGVYANWVAFAPDGTQVAFSASSFAKDGSALQDIRAINTDGTELHTVVAASEARVVLDFPAWSPDGNAIFFTKSRIDASGNQQDEIMRLDLVTRTLQTLIPDAREGNLSPDGKRIVYQKMDPRAYTISLWIADVNGVNPRRIISDGTFAIIAGARFAPDSQRIVFAASGAPTQELPGARAENSCALAVGLICLGERVSAHGAPWDLWIVNLEGTKFQRLTAIGTDNPIPAWSPDGNYVGMLDATGIYVVAPATKSLYQVSTSHGYAGFDWR